MVDPVFKVPGSEHVTYKPEKPIVADLFRQYLQENLMIYLPEAIADISFNKPHSPGGASF